MEAEMAEQDLSVFTNCQSDWKQNDADVFGAPGLRNCCDDRLYHLKVRQLILGQLHEPSNP